MALLGAALRVGGGALARNITGRKKKVKPSAIAPEKVMNQETPKKGGGLVRRPTSKTALAKPMNPLQMASTSAVSKDDPLKVIHVKVLEIESILKGTLAAEKEEQKRKKQELQDQRRAQQEEGLEKNPKKKPEKKPKMPKKMPSGGIFGFIKNIIGSFIMNYFVKFLIDNAKTVANILKVVVSVTDFLANAGIQIFNALATFVDWGYKAIDATRGFIKTIGGEGLAQNFDKVTNLVGTALFLATTIAGSMAVEALTSGGGSDDGGLLDFIRKKGAKKVAGKVAAKGAIKGAAGTAARGAGVAAGTAAAVVAGVGLLSSALGEGAFQLRKIGKGLEGGAKKRYEEKSFVDPRKPIDWLLYQGARFINHSLNGLGVLLDIVGAPCRYAIELINFGIMSILGDTEGIKRQRKNLAKFDARVREGIRQLLNVATLGFGFKEKGSFGNLFGDEAATKEMVKKMQEGGGVTPGRKPVTRTIERTKKKPKKFFLKKPTKRTVGDPPKDDGKSDRAWWDFLGWAGTGSEKTKMGEGGKQLVTKIADVDKEFAKNDFFGPIITATSKIILGEKPDSTDFNNVGRGINLLINEGLGDERIAKGMIGYQSGGVVDTPPPFLDVESWVQESFKKASNKVSETKPPSTTSFGTTGPEGEGEYDSATGEFMGPGPTTGATTSKFGTAEQKKMLDAIAFAEGTTGSYGTLYGGKVIPELAAGEMSIAEVLKMQKSKMYKGENVYGSGYDSNATGRYQFMSYVLEEEIGKQGVDASEKFTPEMQDRLILNRISRMRKVTPELLAAEGMSDKVIDMLAPEFASFPNLIGPDAQGRVGTNTSYYGQGGKSAAEIKRAYGDSTGEASAIEIGDTSVQPPALSDTPGDGDTSSGGDISVSGSNVVNIGKDLISQGFSVAEHPDFTKTPTASGGTYTPGKGTVSRVHKGAGHYDGRAIDVTDWRGSLEDSKARYRSVLTSLQDNPAIKMLIHDSWGGMYSPGQKQGPGGHGHPTHMHIEVKDKGGFIGKGLFANLGGKEFVTDADSTAALGQVAPGLMMALNQARDSKGVQSALQQYASYEQGAPQTVMVDESSEETNNMSEEQSPMPSFAMSSGSNSYDNSFDFLDYQG